MIKDIYDYPLYRPPSEAYSLILQVTLGCSHNRCTFCDMYKGKRFLIKDIEQIKWEIDYLREKTPLIDRIFLADGDALIIESNKLIDILKYINKKFPERKRISMYATPKSLLLKTEEELKVIRELGVQLLYIGLESGDDEILKKINKGINSEEFILGAKKAKEAGFKISVTVISGIGGNKEDTRRNHAINTAKVVSEVIPDYLGILSLTIQNGTPLYEDLKNGIFEECSGEEIAEELKLLLENIKIPPTSSIVFRSNHISNYLNLQGTLPFDKARLIEEIENILEGKYFIRRYNNGNI